MASVAPSPAGQRVPRATGGDLRPANLQALSWEPQQCAESLGAIFQFATGEAQAAISWYLHAKRSKKLFARSIRAGAILAGATAGVIPIVTQIYTLNGAPLIAPATASVLLAIAATLVVLDRFFGFSSSWMRFIAAEIRIRKVLQEFQMEWEMERASWIGNAPTADQVQRMLARCKAFVSEVNAIVNEETSTWIEEFQRALVQIDEAARTKAEASQLGGVTVEVTNGDQCDQGWYLAIDGGAPRTYLGRSAAVRDVAAGLHTLRVQGTIGGTPRHAETLVATTAGSTASVQLTLS
jgi:hypothetical protein